MTKASTGDRVAAAAQEWIGTPFVWGQAAKGQGCDCKGLVRGVALELGRPEAHSFHGRFAAYRPRKPVPTALLREGMAALFDQVDGPAQDGDVLLLEIRGLPQHLAIATAGGTKAVHAQMSPNARVKETSMRALLKVCRLNSVWRWRDVD